jgi:hypothetical protein
MARIRAKVKGVEPPFRLAHGDPGDQYARTISYLTESELLFQAPTNEHRKMSRSLTPTQ